MKTLRALCNEVRSADWPTPSVRYRFPSATALDRGARNRRCRVSQQRYKPAVKRGDLDLATLCEGIPMPYGTLRRWWTDDGATTLLSVWELEGLLELTGFGLLDQPSCPRELLSWIAGVRYGAEAAGCCRRVRAGTRPFGVVHIPIVDAALVEVVLNSITLRNAFEQVTELLAVGHSVDPSDQHNFGCKIAIEASDAFDDLDTQIYGALPTGVHATARVLSAWSAWGEDWVHARELMRQWAPKGFRSIREEHDGSGDRNPFPKLRPCQTALVPHERPTQQAVPETKYEIR